MDPKIAKKTQDTLGKIIKKPPLTEKLLGKPPFRFLHDIISSVIKTTGFMKGLYSDSELNSENVKDKDAKIAFLQKAIDMACVASGKNLSVKPAKIVAGHEPEKTNEFLQAVAESINKKVDNDSCVRKVLKKDADGSSEKPAEKEKEKEKRRDDKGEKKESRDKGRDKDRDRDRDSKESSSARERSRDRGDRDRDSHHKDRRRKSDEVIAGGRRDEGRLRSSRHRKPASSIDKKPGDSRSGTGSKRDSFASKPREHPPPQLPWKSPVVEEQGDSDRPREPDLKNLVSATEPKIPMEVPDGEGEKVTMPHGLLRHAITLSPKGCSATLRNGTATKPELSWSPLPEEIRNHPEVWLPEDGKDGKENESPDIVNGEKEAPAKLQRPSSAKGSRRRREGHASSDEEDEVAPKKQAESSVGENDLPPQVVAARKMARPPSARPAPPRPKQDLVADSEPAMRLGTGAPTNVIVDGGKDSDDDETFLVEESAAPAPLVQDTPQSLPDAEDGAEHGALVKKMLESKKAPENQTPNRRTEIERPTMTDGAKRKQREQVQKEIDKLRASIQSVTRSANPLGKIMDYVQEDLDSMQKELEKWKMENKEHALELKREKGITNHAVEPLKAQLSELDQAIKHQLDLIAAAKSNILRNDGKITKMLHSVSKSKS